MSGIAGAIALTGRARPDVEAVSRMVQALQGHHWGPRRMCGDSRVILAHRHGDLPDTPDGLQPVVDGATGVAAIIDGHLVNRAELIRGLGDTIRGDAVDDAGLVIAAYARWGKWFVERLEGDFALVLADRARHTTLLARDRLGVKPLYVAEAGGVVWFASTMPALIASRVVDSTVDRDAVREFIAHAGRVASPGTVLAGVQKLPPATLRIIDADGETRDRVYWQPPVRTEVADTTPPRERVDALHEALRAAIRRRLPDTGPVHVPLSGGLYSSLLVALLTDCHLGPVHTLSLGFDGVGHGDQEELHHAGVVARRYGTRHQALQVPVGELAATVHGAVDDMIEPIGDPEAVALHLASRHLPDPTRPVWFGRGPVEAPRSPERLRDLAEGPLVRIDSKTRAWSVQAEVPFLDRAVVELVAADPAAAARGETPRLVSTLAREVLPPRIASRPRHRPALPAAACLDGPLLDLARDTLRSRAAQERALVQPFLLERWLAAPQRRGGAAGSALWALTVLELWLQRHAA